MHDDVRRLKQAGGEPNSGDAGTVDWPDQWQHDLSAVRVSAKHKLVTATGRVIPSVGRMAEKHFEFSRDVASPWWLISHPWSLAAGDKNREPFENHLLTVASHTGPPGFLQCAADVFMVVAPVMISKDEPAGGMLCERPEDFDSLGQQFRSVDQVTCEEDGIRGMLQSKANKFAIEREAGSAGEVQIGEVQKSQRPVRSFVGAVWGIPGCGSGDAYGFSIEFEVVEFVERPDSGEGFWQPCDRFKGWRRNSLLIG